MITINEPLTIAQTQTWVVTDVHQVFNNENKLWCSVVTYTMYNENNEFIDTYELRYSNEDYNKWFNDYNSGVFLLQNLLNAKNITATLDNNVAEEFLNSI